MDSNRHAVLGPYVPRLVIDWLEHTPELLRRSVDGSLVFADVSGFTQLTELLAANGKIGAEEMGDILNALFDELLTAAYQHGAGLVKWGGDAVLLLFTGADHALHAAKASLAMQGVIARAGRVVTSVGPVQLRMSIGVHTGPTDFLLVGHQHRELIVTGPGATAVANAEKAADAGEVVVTTPVAAALARSGFAAACAPKGEMHLLVDPLDEVAPTGIPAPPGPTTVRMGIALPPAIRDHLLQGKVESEHRQVTVGFIEFAGADALASAADERLLTDAIEALVDATQVAADRNDITLLSTDVNADGGKLILISGAPRAVGDDEARVVTAVRTILDQPNPLRLRAGVSVGRVFAGDFGPFYRRNYSVAGDSVNLAARLMAHATPGQLLVTREVHDRAKVPYRAAPVPPFLVKGKQEPVTAFSIEPAIITTVRAASTVPLVGRPAELASLRDLLAHAKAGHGCSVDVVGPAGIGKSRLVEELARDDGSTVVWVDGDVYGASAPYRAVQRAVRGLLALDPTASSDELATALRSVVAEAAPSLLPWLPLIGLVIGVELPATPEVADLALSVRKERMEAAVSDLLGATLTGPTLFVFNDSHLMDEATLDLISRLRADASGRPWLVVMTHRTPPADPDAHTPHRIDLGPLDPPDAAELLGVLTDESPLPPHRVGALAARSGGNPLFLSALAAELVQRGDSGDVPDSIDGLITSHIDRLPPGRRQVLRTAAVIGMTMAEDLLTTVLRRDGALAADDAADLGGLDEFLTVSSREVRFLHHLTRDAAYEGLPYRRRTELHAAIADALLHDAAEGMEPDADLLSLHSLRGRRFAAAWDYGLRAAAQARSRYANADAADCYRRAIRAAEEGRVATRAELGEVLEALGEIHYLLGEHPAAEACLRRAHRIQELPPVVRARICLRIARVRQDLTRYSASQRWITKGLALLDDAADVEATRLRAVLAADSARLRYVTGRPTAARQRAQQALALAEEAGDDEAIGRALEYLDLSEAALGLSSTEAPGQRALAIYQAIGDLPGQGRLHIALGARAYFAGRWAEAIDHYESAGAAYERAGQLWDAAVATVNIAEVLCELGDAEPALQLLDSAVRTFRGYGSVGELAFTRYLAGRLHALQRDHERALEELRAASETFHRTGRGGDALMVDATIAEVLNACERHAEALELADTSLRRVATRGGGEPLVPMLHRIRAAALVGRGDGAGARDALVQSLEIAQARDAQQDVAAALEALVALGPEHASPAEIGMWRDQLAEATA